MMPACEVLPVTSFNGLTRTALPPSCDATGNSARTVMMNVKNGRHVLGFNLFGQGT